VEVALAESALGGLAHGGESRHQQAVEVGAVGELLAEGVGAGPQLRVRETLELRLQLVDRLDRGAVGLELAIVGGAEDLGRDRTDGQHPDGSSEILVPPTGSRADEPIPRRLACKRPPMCGAGAALAGDGPSPGSVKGTRWRTRANKRPVNGRSRRAHFEIRTGTCLVNEGGPCQRRRTGAACRPQFSHETVAICRYAAAGLSSHPPVACKR